MKKIIIIIISSLVISLLIAPLRAAESINIGSLSGFKLTSILALFIYYIFTSLLLYTNKKKIKDSYIILSIIIGFSIIRLPIHIIYFQSTKNALLEYFMHLLPVIGAYICFKIRNFKWLFSLILFLVGIWLSTIGYDYWGHKVNFKTFTGKIIDRNLIMSDTLILQTSEGVNLSLTNFKGKYLLLDCWHTYCGICYKKMPKLQYLYENYKDNKALEIYALHCRLEDNIQEKENYDKGKYILEREGYSIPCLSISIKNQNLKKLGVEAYPTVLIFDKESNLIFRGNIEKAKDFLSTLLE